jgi:predicted tellurium resistance membrane protein TerC
VQPQNEKQWIAFVIWVGCQLAIEHWLGKTQKTQASSIVELVMMLATLVFTLILTRRKKDEPGSPKSGD